MSPVEGKGGADAAAMMMVSCPRCKTRYRVQVADVPAEGRQLRCVRCSLSWFFVPPTATPLAHDGQSGLLPGLSTAGEGGKTRSADYWPEFWWGYAVATVGILMAAAYVFREDVSSVLPALHAPLEAYANFLENLFLR